MSFHLEASHIEDFVLNLFYMVELGAVAMARNT